MVFLELCLLCAKYEAVVARDQQNIKREKCHA